MSALYAIAMGALALAVPIAWLAPARVRERLASCCSAAGCVLLVIVGIYAAVGHSEPVINLGAWLGFGHSALRADGLAGIFLALTGITGAAVSLAYAELPAGRWLTTLASTMLLFIAVAIGSDNGFLFFLAWEAITVCVYLIASAGRTREDLLGGYLTGGLGAARRIRTAVRAHAQLLAGRVGARASLCGNQGCAVRAIPHLLRNKGRRAAPARRSSGRLRLGATTRCRLTVGRAVRRVLRPLALRVRRARTAADRLRGRAADRRRGDRGDRDRLRAHPG